jgi:signal transduction histidine kinase
MKSLTFRLAFAFTVIVTVTTALLLVLGGWLLSRQMMKGMELLHEAEFQEVRDRLEPNPAALTPEEVSTRIRDHAEIDAAMFFFQIHAAGQIVFRSPNLGETLLPDPGDARLHWPVKVAPHGRLLISEFLTGPWHVQIASPLEPTQRLLADYAQVSGLLLGLVLIASAGLGYGFARLALNPVRSIQQTAARIRGDNLGERIPVPATGDEISALADLLNQMFDRLEVSFKQVRRFTADASHELKTPLALIRLSAEKIRSRVADDEEAAAELGELLEEVNRLNQIIEMLLFLAKADAGVLAPELRRESLPPFIEAVAEDAAVLAEDGGVRFELTVNEPGHARFQPTLIRQLLLNLINNALNVSERGNRLSLTSQCEAGRWRLQLTDEGPGLPEAQLAKIFERFVRYEHRAGERRGHGLGLAICRSIVELHGGTITAANRRDTRGLQVTVVLPLDPA